MSTFKQFLEAGGAPAGGHLYSRPYPAMPLSPPSPRTTSGHERRQRIRNWEMGVLDKFLDLFDTMDASHAVGKVTIIPAVYQGQDAYFVPQTHIGKYHPAAVELLQQKGILSTQTFNNIIDSRDNQVYQQCYRMYPENAEAVLSNDRLRWVFYQSLKRIAMGVLQKAGQGTLERFPNTSIWGA